jgi:hypothetical protein
MKTSGLSTGRHSTGGCHCGAAVDERSPSKIGHVAPRGSVGVVVALNVEYFEWSPAVCTVGSARLGTGELNYLGPFFDFASVQPSEFRGRERQHGPTEIGKMRFHFRIGESRIDLTVQLVHDFIGGVPGRANAVDYTGLIIWKEFSHGWNAGNNSERAVLVTASARN